MNLKKIALSACVAIVLAVPTAGMAATATGNLTVQIYIGGTCAVQDGTLIFPNQPNLTGGNVDAAGTFGVDCSIGLPYDVGLDNGGNFTTTRRMDRAGTEFINYSLYKNAGYTDAWGNTVGTDTVSGTGTGAVQTIDVYGRVPGAQGSPSTGLYSDTVTITVTY